MIITTWNIQGYKPSKLSTITRLLQHCDALVLTEVWTEVPDFHEGFHVLNCQAPRKQASAKGRESGGVSFIIPLRVQFRKLQQHSQQEFQALSVSIRGTPVVGVYLRPKTPVDTLAHFKTQLRRMARGSSVIIGDLNARHELWDTATNTHGRMLRDFALSTHSKVLAPSASTCRNPRGESKIDLAITRNISAELISVLSIRQGLSEHLPVRFDLMQSQPSTVDFVPLGYISNKLYRARVRHKYNRDIPRATEDIKNSSDPSSLSQAARKLAAATLQPWAALRRPRPNRWRPGWSLELDRLAKQRSRLLKKNDVLSKRQARLIDGQIKKKHKHNLRKLQEQVGDLLENNVPGQESVLTKSLLSLHREEPVADHEVDPDKFTLFMSSLQPSNVPLIGLSPSQDLPASFKTSIAAALAKANKKKAPGPDKIRTEMFQVAPSLFTQALYELTKACMRLGYAPALLTSGLLRPIYKSRGDPAEPSSYRPINLTTAFRRIISSAILKEVEKLFVASTSQWGFQRGTSTGCAVAQATNYLRGSISHAAFLDLKKAYDVLPRAKLLKILERRLPSTLAQVIKILLVPMTLKTRNQKSATCVLTTTGVPQGDPSSPTLFNIFMDDFIAATHLSLDTAVVCYADDVTLLARTLQLLKDMLGIADHWADSCNMSWNALKSYGLDLPEQLCIGGAPMQNVKEVKHLGVTLSKQGVSHTNLLSRINRAHGELSKFFKYVFKWNLTVRQKRNLVKTFIFPLLDYLSYLHPVTGAVLQATTKLERRVLNFVLAVPIAPFHEARAFAMAQLLPFQARRTIAMIKTVARIYAQAVHPDNLLNTHVQRNWQAISKYATISALLRARPIPVDHTKVAEWAASLTKQVRADVWGRANVGARKVPFRDNKHPPALDSQSLTRFCRKKAILWYLNKLKPNSNTKPFTARLKALLEKQHLSDDETEELENILHLF